MNVLTASAYLNASIFSTVGPIALLVGLVYWYVRTVGKLPWSRNELPESNGQNQQEDTTSDSSGSAAGSA